jgi:hypothetical protein
MAKSVFDKVKKVNAYPSLTILLPTHRTAPENQQDAIRLKNLIKSAHERLESEFSKRDLAALYANLEKADEINHEYNKEGLAIFANADVFEYARLPFVVEERVVVDETFATRDLIRELNQANAFYVVALSREQVHLFEVAGNEGHEVKAHGFPMKNHGDHTGEMRDNAKIQEFFNQVDKNFYEVYKDHPAELVVAGIERNITFYKEVSDHKELILATMGGDYSSSNINELVKACIPVAKEAAENRVNAELERLEQAVAHNKFTDDVQEIWQMVNQGRAETLLVEKNYFQAAKVDGDKLELVEDATEEGVVDDIVDEIAEITLKMGGKVVFVEDGKLDKYQRIALIDRY